MAWSVLLLMGSSAAAAPSDAELATLSGAAALSPRPAICGSANGVWERSRTQPLRSRCVMLARAYAALRVDPKRASELASVLVDSELRVEASILLARAQLAGGDAERAWATFQSATQNGEVPLSNLGALRDAAIAASLVGQHEHALVRYRAIVSRWQLLQPRERVPVLVEASMAALRAGSRDATAEAGRYLALAERHHEHRGGLRIVRAAAAFVSARAGAPPARMPELEDPGFGTPEQGERGEHLLRLPLGELAALTAVSNERSDPEAARVAWEAYLQAPVSEPLRDWVRERIRALGEVE